MQDEDKTKEQLINEITELRQQLSESWSSFEDLKRSEAKYRMLAEATPAFTHVTQGSKFVYVNPEQAIGEQLHFKAAYEDTAGRLIGLVGMMIDITEHKRVEDALQKSEEEYRTIFETTGTATVIIEEDMIISLANTGFEKISGCSKEEIEGKKSWTEFFVQGDLERTISYHRLRRIDPNAAPRQYETGFINKQGTVKSVLTTASMIPGTGKSVVSFLDITGLKQAEEAVKQSEEKFRTLFEKAPVGIDITRENKTLLANQAYLKMFGYKDLSEIVGTSVLSHFAPQLRKEADETIKGREEGRLPQGSHEAIMQRKDGSLFSCCLEGARIELPDGPALTDFFTDITGRKRIEEELRKYREHLEKLVELRTAKLQELNAQLQLEISERGRLEEARARLDDIIETTSDFVATADLDGRVLYYNIAARKVLGIGENEDISHIRIPDAHPDWAKRVILEEAIPVAINDGIWQGEAALLTRSGQEIPVSMVLIAHKGPDGNVAYFSTIIRDITERKRKEEQIRILNEDLEHRAMDLSITNKELESFAYSVSHDLRAPLRSIHGFSQALLEDYADCLDEQGKEYLERLKISSKRMAQLIDGLLDLSRITRYEMYREQVDLSALALAIVAELQMMQPERQVAIDIQEGLTAEGDPRLLQVMLENLLGNAWKFTGNNAETRVSFGITLFEGEQVYFVRDNGAGFDMAYAGKLFGPFQRLHSQTEFPGTGIGLATVQRIIHRHGGKIWAESEIGKGAAFYFTLA